MGAYENPRLINAPDFATGFENFDKKFQAGLKEGFAEGQKKIEKDKLYVAGVEESAEEMRLAGEAAIKNGSKTREEIDLALKDFYAEALEVEPGGKGLGGLFSGGRKMLGDIDLKKLENDFSDKVAPLNDMYNKIYDPEFVLEKDSDMSDDQFHKLEQIHNAVKQGRIKTNFGYKRGKERGFSSNLEILDAKGNVIDTYSTADLSSIINNNTKALRLEIDTDNNKVKENSSGLVVKEVNNEVERLKAEGATKKSYIEGKNFLGDAVDGNIGTAGFYKMKDGVKVINMNDDGSYNNVPQVGSDSFNRLSRLYSNHTTISDDKKLEILTNTVPGIKGMDKSVLMEIIGSNFKMGTEKLKGILGPALKSVAPAFPGSDASIDNVLKNIHDGTVVAKSLMYKASVEQEIENTGILNKAYLPPVTTGSGGGGNFDKDLFNINKANNFAQQQLNKTLKLPGLVLKSAPGGLGGGGGFRTLDVNKLGFDEIKASDGTGNFVNKQITGSTLSSNGLLKIEYEQESEVIETDSGKVDAEGNPILERKVSAPKVKGNNYNVFTLNGLENLFKDIGGTTVTQNASVENVYPSYFREQVYQSIQQNFEADPKYLADPQTRELREALLQYKFQQGETLASLNKNPKYKDTPWFQNIFRNSQKLNK